jgi:chromosome segregation ATPase
LPSTPTPRATTRCASARSLIDRLRGQLQSVEFDLDQVRSALAKAEQQAGELRTDQARAEGSSTRCERRDRELRGMDDEKRRSDERAAQARPRTEPRSPRHHQPWAHGWTSRPPW